MKKSPWKITLSDISFSKKEEQAVIGVLRSRWLTMGEATQKFEDQFKKLHGVKHAFAVTNCTAGLHMANIALGIKAGDEVICPALTFVATANSILYVGAKPIFSDITSSQDLNISPQDIEKRITPKTKAIIVVHYAGYPCDMKKINNIAKTHNIKIIEDCAHAPLTRYKNKYLGTYGDIGVFSFFSNKNMTAGEGGMVITNNDGLAQKIKNLRSHSMTYATLDRHKGHAFSYDVIDLGFNFRMDEMRAALGSVQLEKVSVFNAKRQALVKYYHTKLENMPNTEIPFKDFSLRESSCHIFPILLKDNAQRDTLQKFLKKSKIQTSIHYPPINKFSHYQKLFPNVTLPKTEDVASRLLTLPLYPKLQRSQIDYITKKIKEFLCVK